MNLTKPLRKSNIMVQNTDGETILYSAENKAIHILNPTAECIWRLCDGKHTVTDMEQTLRATFAIPDEYNVTQDVQQTLQLFADKELLQETF